MNILGYTLTFDKEVAGLVVDLATLATTIYFTRTLVKNDVARTKDAENEKLIQEYKLILSEYVINGDELAKTAKTLLERYPKTEKLIYDAVLKICVDSKMRSDMLTHYQQCLKEKGINQ